jgi:hypothetical protein
MTVKIKIYKTLQISIKNFHQSLQSNNQVLFIKSKKAVNLFQTILKEYYQIDKT